MTRRTLIRATAVLLALGLSACAGNRNAGQTITIKGSDTMVILGQRWAEQYMKSHPGVVIQVTGGGTGTGIAALVNGTTDICQASRPMKDEEKSQIAAKYGAPPYETTVARDGIAIYLHESNEVDALSMAQLRGIYTGAITSWKQVGGADAGIVLYGRENSSGTYEYFKEHVLEKADYASTVQTLPGTAAVVNAVSKDPRGIGYGGAAYAKGVKECAVKATDASAAVKPAAETVRDGTYPISRALYFYTRKPPEGSMKAFVDWVLSDEGQKIATEVGYYSVR